MMTSIAPVVPARTPNWLAPHGAMTSNQQVSDYAAVFVDGQFVGDINALRSWALETF